MLQGKIPQSDIAQQQLASVAKSFNLGTGGSKSFTGNLVARDLGLKQLDLTQKGLTAAEQWLNSTEQLYNPALINYNRMFITPEQEFGAAVEERNTQFAHDWLKNQIGAMPDPQVSGLIDLFSGQGAIKTIYGGAQGFQNKPNTSTGTNSGLGSNPDVGWSTDTTNPAAWDAFDASSAASAAGTASEADWLGILAGGG